MSSAKDQLLLAIEELSVWEKRGERAPHKPLLLLIAFARFQQNSEVQWDFEEIEALLETPLWVFGAPRKSQHPEYPFWHLQSDGLWQVSAIEEMESSPERKRPKVTELRKKAKGGFTDWLADAIRNDPDLIQQASRKLLVDHFPSELHGDICRML